LGAVAIVAVPCGRNAGLLSVEPAAVVGADVEGAVHATICTFPAAVPPTAHASTLENPDDSVAGATMSGAADAGGPAAVGTGNDRAAEFGINRTPAA
jgi:hypothetical protein